jgi:hypothetical protein
MPRAPTATRLEPAALRPRTRDTRLESEGAEFLVLGSLLAEGIPAWKAYPNFPGYDILAGYIDKQRTCRIQLKSRFATGAGGFPIRNLDSDFVCFVRLNRGSRNYLRLEKSARRIPTDIETGRLPPEIYVFPKRVIRAAWTPATPFGGGVQLKNIPNPDRYLHAWGYITAFLDRPARRPRARV